MRLVTFPFLALICLLVFLLGIPSGWWIHAKPFGSNMPLTRVPFSFKGWVIGLADKIIQDHFNFKGHHPGRLKSIWCLNVKLGSVKIEYGNSNDKMTKTNSLKFRCFCHWNIYISVIVSDFDIRISNLQSKYRGFRSSTISPVLSNSSSQYVISTITFT